MYVKCNGLAQFAIAYIRIYANSFTTLVLHSTEVLSVKNSMLAQTGYTRRSTYTVATAAECYCTLYTLHCRR